MKEHIKPEEFAKSQKYGQDKAKFALFSKIYSQGLDSALLHYGFYAWCWEASGKLLAKTGYGSEYEVSTWCPFLSLYCRVAWAKQSLRVDYAKHRFLIPSVLPFFDAYYALERVLHVRLGREAWLQQDDAWLVRSRSSQGMGYRFRAWCTLPRRVLEHLQVGGGPLCSLVDGIHVSHSLRDAQ